MFGLEIWLEIDLILFYIFIDFEYELHKFFLHFYWLRHSQNQSKYKRELGK